ncbi:MAG: hypothetical protein M3Y37_07685, partial [Chloroflexota bacterium]|nr:hypothetical protein [Chloroflexota bacterium]
MNELPTPSRRSLRPSDTVDDLGSVPDGYSFAPETQQFGWQGENPAPVSASNYSPVDTARSNKAAKSAGRAIREIVE